MGLHTSFRKPGRETVNNSYGSRHNFLYSHGFYVGLITIYSQSILLHTGSLVILSLALEMFEMYHVSVEVKEQIYLIFKRAQ
jgi:hypothetical protein